MNFGRYGGGGEEKRNVTPTPSDSEEIEEDSLAIVTHACDLEKASVNDSDSGKEDDDSKMESSLF